MKKQHAELMYAYKKEPNPKTKERMLAVFNVVEGGETIPMIARLFHKSYNSIKNWIARFKKLGTVGFDLDPSFWYRFLHTFPYDFIPHLFFPSNLRTNSLGVRFQCGVNYILVVACKRLC